MIKCKNLSKFGMKGIKKLKKWMIFLLTSTKGLMLKEDDVKFLHNYFIFFNLNNR